MRTIQQFIVKADARVTAATLPAGAHPISATAIGLDAIVVSFMVDTERKQESRNIWITKRGVPLSSGIFGEFIGAVSLTPIAADIRYVFA